MQLARRGTWVVRPTGHLDSEQQIDAQTQQYRVALERLEAAIPGAMVSPEERELAFHMWKPRLADERNSIPCPCGFGRLIRWPWGRCT